MKKRMSAQADSLGSGGAMWALFAQPPKKMWAFFRDKDNRELVGWVCGGLVVLIGAVWAVFTYFVPTPSVKPPATPQQVDCTIVAHQSLTACRDVNAHDIVIGSNDTRSTPAK
jgi:hypothetical protein